MRPSRCFVVLVAGLVLLAGCADGEPAADPAETTPPTADEPAPDDVAADEDVAAEDEPADDDTTGEEADEEPGEEPPADDRPAAPDFTLTLSDGEEFTLSAEERAVYLIFWAEW